jgi:hypothetical protein
MNGLPGESVISRRHPRNDDADFAGAQEINSSVSGLLGTFVETQ